MEIPPGMFIVSKAIKEESELDGWIRHFNEKGIDTRIIKDSRGKYYLCREGLESRSCS
jgi:hypothetical protein